MPARRLSVKKIREVLRLLWSCGLSERQAGRGSGVGRSTAAEYRERAGAAGLSTFEEVEALGEEELELRLFPEAGLAPRRERRAGDWPVVHEELKRKGVTLQLLWEEYRVAEPLGYSYSRWCELYGEWRGKLGLVMRQSHKAGEKLFVDYAGPTVPVIDGATGEVREAQVFVAVLGASNYTFAEATWTQTLPDWMGSHVRAFGFLGGVPELVVPDNLKSGVSRACRYEPDVNPTYQDLATHYGVAVIPARAVKPRDKAKVEVGVQVVERWILARLRKRTFFSLAELNEAIRDLLVGLNDRPFKKLPGSRRSVFLEVERPVLRALPITPYEYADWKKAKVNIDYHVEVDGHYYSVPYQLVGETLDVRLTARTIECFSKEKRVASHGRSREKGRHTTVAEHMPRAHREHAEWTPERVVRWAGETGPSVAAVVKRIMESRIHPQQGFRPSLGILRLGKRYGSDRVEAACRRALACEAISFRSIKSILEKGLDRQPLVAPPPDVPPIAHENIRGAGYFDSEVRPC